MNPAEPRDRALEALLSGRARTGPATAQCLDAETLAAYVDGGLDAPARAEAETHVAGCARCQTMMAEVVTSAGGVEPSPAAAAGRAWWQFDLRWLVPLAGAAAAVVLWTVVPTGGPPAQSARFEDASRPAAIAPPAEAPSQMAAPPPATLADAPAPVPASPPNLEKKAATEPARQAAARQLDPGRRERAESDDATARNEAPGRADLLAKAAEPPAPAAAPMLAAPAVAEEFRAADRSVAAAGATAAGAADLRSLDPAVRWRLAEPGIVERSTNGGASWDRLDTGVRTPLRAGACPSSSTCWIVGDAGTVILTTDARTWRRLASPSPEDLAAVEAANEAAAVVRTAGGRRFRTSDGGTTWTLEP